MGNFFFEEETKSDDKNVLKIEIEFDIPIVGINLEPKIQIEKSAACIFRWYKIKSGKPKRSIISGELLPNKVLISQSIEYVPTQEDIGCLLEFSCTLLCNKSGGVTRDFKTKKVLECPKPSNHRKWKFYIQKKTSFVVQVKKESGGGGGGKEKSEKGGTILESLISSNMDVNLTRFTCLCYNLMSQVRSTKNNFPNVTGTALSFVYRKKLLMEELLAFDCDLMCLQEIDYQEFTDYWELELSKKGYSPYFPSRDSDLRRSRFPFGCCIFYRRYKFGVSKQWITEFDKTIDKHPYIASLCKREKLDAEKLKNTHKYAQIVRILYKDYIEEDVPDSFLLCNTQLNKPQKNVNADECLLIQILQILLLTTVVNDILEKTLEEDEKSSEFDTKKVERLPVVLCGDFSQSSTGPVYQFLSTGKLDLKPYLPSTKQKKELKDDFCTVITHNIKSLKSSYKDLCGKEPRYRRNVGGKKKEDKSEDTNLITSGEKEVKIVLSESSDKIPPLENGHLNLVETKSYLWFDSKLKVTRCLEEDILSAYPSHFHSSDKLPLITEFDTRK